MSQFPDPKDAITLDQVFIQRREISKHGIAITHQLHRRLSGETDGSVQASLGQWQAPPLAPVPDFDAVLLLQALPQHLHITDEAVKDGFTLPILGGVVFLGSLDRWSGPWVSPRRNIARWNGSEFYQQSRGTGGKPHGRSGNSRGGARPRLLQVPGEKIIQQPVRPHAATGIVNQGTFP